MANNYFSFNQFTIYQDKSAFKVGTDGVLLGSSADITGVSNILFVGSGTGLVSILLAQRCSASVTAIEPDYDSFIDFHEILKIFFFLTFNIEFPNHRGQRQFIMSVD